MASRGVPDEATPTRVLEELNDLLWALPSSLDPDQIAAVLLERSTRLFRAPLAAMWEVDDGAEHLTGAFGFTEKKAEQLWQRLELGGTDRTLRLSGPDLHALGGFGKRRLGALLAVPLRAHERTLGWLVFARLDPEPFSDLETSFVEVLASRVAGALAAARQYQNTHARSEELALMNEIAALLVSTTRLDDVLALLTKRMVEMMHLTACYVGLLTPAKDMLKVRAAYHRDPAQSAQLMATMQEQLRHLDEGRSAEVYKSREPFLIDNVMTDPVVPDRIRAYFGHATFLLMPLISRGEYLGTMYWVRQGRQNPFTRDVLPLAANLANQVSVAIANARLYEDLEAQIASRTENLRRVYEQLAHRFVSGRNFVREVTHELGAHEQALEQQLAAMATGVAAEDLEAVRRGLASTQAALAELRAAHGRLVERLERGDSQPLPGMALE